MRNSRLVSWKKISGAKVLAALNSPTCSAHQETVVECNLVFLFKFKSEVLNLCIFLFTLYLHDYTSEGNTYIW